MAKRNLKRIHTISIDPPLMLLDRSTNFLLAHDPDDSGDIPDSGDSGAGIPARGFRGDSGDTLLISLRSGSGVRLPRCQVTSHPRPLALCQTQPRPRLIGLLTPGYLAGTGHLKTEGFGHSLNHPTRTSRAAWGGIPGTVYLTPASPEPHKISCTASRINVAALSDSVASSSSAVIPGYLTSTAIADSILAKRRIRSNPGYSPNNKLTSASRSWMRGTRTPVSTIMAFRYFSAHCWA